VASDWPFVQNATRFCKRITKYYFIDMISQVALENNKKLAKLTFVSNGNLQRPPHLKELKKGGKRTWFKLRCRRTSTVMLRMAQGPSSWAARGLLDFCVITGISLRLREEYIDFVNRYLLLPSDTNKMRILTFSVFLFENYKRECHWQESTARHLIRMATL